MEGFEVVQLVSQFFPFTDYETDILRKKVKDLINYFVQC